MAWFIGQSAVMILLAFLLGLLVGWIIWGRRLRALLIEVRDLRAFKAECEANHGPAAATASVPVVAEPVVAEPVVAEPVVAEPAVAESVVAAEPASNGKSTSQPVVEPVVTAPAEPATAGPVVEPVAATVHIPSPRAEVADVNDLDVSSSSRSGGLDTVVDDGLVGDQTADGTAAADTTHDAAADGIAADGAGSVGDEVHQDVEGTNTDVDVDAATHHGAGYAHAGASTAPIAAVETSAVAGAVGLAATDSADHDSQVDETLAAPLDETPAAPLDETPAAPADEPADDLARIEGIGPKIAAALVASGIHSYRQLAAADTGTLTRAINGAGIKFAPSLVTWSQQASLLADGDEEAFVALTDRLIAGREAAKKNGAVNGTPVDSAMLSAAAVDEPVGGEPAVGEPVVDEPVVDEPVVDEPVVDEPAVDEPAVDEAAVDGAAGDDAVEEAVAAEPIVAQPEPLPDPDDLSRIEGIGPKIAAALVAAGIRTFEQLAGADTESLTTAINSAGIKFAPSLVTWAEQARLLADGDEDGFAVLTARLIAGRRADDDLQRIEGIGPQMAAALHSAGIRTYRALADSSDTKLRNAVSGAGLSFAPSIVTWARQARLLADGDEDGFADLTRRLVSGRDEGRV